ncbi:MAG: N-acetylneuraminate synthase [Gammaproteobacteria bacterium]|nr:N-acetylneuraminate synthase [Gammaproteobacteria bacterium]
MTATFIIAEAGVNHNGDETLAFKLIDAAVAAGADAVKFQTFKAKNLVTAQASKARYQQENDPIDESQMDMLAKLELPFEAHHKLMKYAKQQGIMFLSSAFDHDSLDFLVNDLGLTLLKIASGEITNSPFILAHARTQCQLILSTGMSNLAEIEQALAVIAFGYTAAPDVPPSHTAFKQAYHSDLGQAALREKVTLLHCTTQYPAPFEQINLNAMSTMASHFNLAVGYSDHSQGIVVPIAAVAQGACIIEKHFTLDKTLPGPDHQASLIPAELTAMVSAIRNVELACGSHIKVASQCEIENKSVARKSLVAKVTISKGQPLTSANLDIKRPGHGICPTQYWHYLGTTATKAYQPGELINE